MGILRKDKAFDRLDRPLPRVDDRRIEVIP